MIQQRRFIVLTLLLAVAAGSWAARVTRLDVIGFSADGRYVAYEILGPYDESGRAFSIIQIVDVLENDFVTDDIVTKTDDKTFPPEEELQAANRIQAQPLLDRYGIIDGNGGLVAYQLEQMEPWEAHIQMNKQIEVQLIDQQGRTQAYTIELAQRVSNGDACRSLDDWDLKPRIFTLSIHSRDWNQVLQQDSVLYASRKCPYTYAVDTVIVYADRIAIFLNAYSIGFEGSDVNKLVVTGTLDQTITSVQKTVAPPIEQSWHPTLNPTAPFVPVPDGDIALAGPDQWAIIVALTIDDTRTYELAGFFYSRIHRERFQGALLVPGALDPPGSLKTGQRFTIRAMIRRPDGGELFRELSGQIRHPTRLILYFNEAGTMQLIDAVG